MLVAKDEHFVEFDWKGELLIGFATHETKKIKEWLEYIEIVELENLIWQLIKT